MNSVVHIANNSSEQECCVRVLIPTAVWSRLSKCPLVVGMWEFNFIRNIQEPFLIPIHCLWLLSRVYVEYIGSKNAARILLNGLHRLEYRGYDSAGMALVSNGNLNIYKCAGRVADLEKYIEGKDTSATVY